MDADSAVSELQYHSSWSDDFNLSYSLTDSRVPVLNVIVEQINTAENDSIL